jgi:hypothetical protein
MAAVAGVRLPAQLLIFLGIVVGIVIEPFALLLVGVVAIALLWR